MPIEFDPALPEFRAPTHVVVRGADPTASNLAGYAVAASMDPELALLEIRPGAGASTPGAVRWEDRVAPERHLISLAPEPEAAGEPVNLLAPWPIVRADRPQEILSNLAEFLAAPEASEQALRRRFPIRHPMAILIANGWIVARRFPDIPDVTGRLMEVQKRFGVSVVLATDRTPRRDLAVFDVVFDVLDADGGEEPMRLRCARATGSTDLRAGDDFRVLDAGGLPPSLGPSGTVSVAAPATTPGDPDSVGPGSRLSAPAKL
ncbi:MAG: hypothetical protein L3J80_01795 [Thermoplasmata archaeon]|nr:hypothetical protein [Thermoplasmata archaeon]